MDNHKKVIFKKRIEKVTSALMKNNMAAYYVETKAELLPLVSSLLKPGNTISSGGSMTLEETGVMELIKTGDYVFSDRNLPDLSVAEKAEANRKAYTADAYFASVNAVTENGELYLVDGMSNRVSAVLYGPQSVILIVGVNKIVRNLDEAVNRVKKIAAPANCVRLGIQAPCVSTGECVSMHGNNSEITAGCKSEQRICSNFVILTYQVVPERIKVILVGEDLGY